MSAHRTSGALFTAVIVVLLATLSNKGRRTCPALVTGFASMSWWLLLMTAWQTHRGTVYSEVGLLTALFLAGTAGGALASRKARNPRRLLSWLFPAAATVSAMLAFSLPPWLVPIALVACGAITGVAFPGLAALAVTVGNDIGIGASRAFAADEVGAAVAAAVIGIIALPLLGSSWVSLAIALLCAAVIPGIFRAQD